MGVILRQLLLQKLKLYLVSKILLTLLWKKNSSDRDKLLKYKAEGRELAKILRSLEQIYLNGTECFFNLFLEVSQI